MACHESHSLVKEIKSWNSSKQCISTNFRPLHSAFLKDASHLCSKRRRTIHIGLLWWIISRYFSFSDEERRLKTNWFQYCEKKGHFTFNISLFTLFYFPLLALLLYPIFWEMAHEYEIFMTKSNGPSMRAAYSTTNSMLRPRWNKIIYACKNQISLFGGNATHGILLKTVTGAIRLNVSFTGRVRWNKIPHYH